MAVQGIVLGKFGAYYILPVSLATFLVRSRPRKCEFNAVDILTVEIPLLALCWLFNIANGVSMRFAVFGCDRSVAVYWRLLDMQLTYFH